MAVFQGNELYTNAQGGCYICRRADQLVSTEVDIEGEGTLVFCRGCILDLARAARPALDLISTEVITGLEEQAAAAHEAVRKVEAEKADLQARFDNLRREWVEAIEKFADA